MMKPVIKVDFKIEQMAIQEYQTYIELFEIDGKLLPYMGNPRGICKQDTIKKKIYDIYESFDNRIGTINYAIEDTHLLHTLLRIGKDRLENILREASEFSRSNGHKDGYNSGIESGKRIGKNETLQMIRRLPWWKRLLGKF